MEIEALVPGLLCGKGHRPDVIEGRQFRAGLADCRLTLKGIRMTEQTRISYSELTKYRRECARRFGKLLDLPVISFSREQRSLIRTGVRLLEVGCGVHKPLKDLVDEAGGQYVTLDSDPAGDFDFCSFEEMPAGERFDVVVANQVLEHLTVPQAVGMVRCIADHLAEGGVFMATIPNSAHPVRFWGDAMHVTAWPWGDFYGLFRVSGLWVDRLFRYNKFALSRNPIKRYFIHVVCTTFRVDWCDSLMAMARKSDHVSD